MPLTVLATRETLYLLREDHQWRKNSLPTNENKEACSGSVAVLETLPISCVSSVLLWPSDQCRMDIKLYDEVRMISHHASASASSRENSCRSKLRLSASERTEELKMSLVWFRTSILFFFFRVTLSCSRSKPPGSRGIIRHEKMQTLPRVESNNECTTALLVMYLGSNCSSQEHVLAYIWFFFAWIVPINLGKQTNSTLVFWQISPSRAVG